MVYSLSVREAHRIDLPPSLALAARLMTIVLALACMLWLSISGFLIGSKEKASPFTDDLRPSAELAWTSPGMDGQMSIGLGDVKINIEAYNKKRVKDIAQESRKLVSLAQSLKLDLQLAPGSDARPNSIRKADEIQKLAHDVKESMKLNLVVPQ
jgi:hypothetical protein